MRPDRATWLLAGAALLSACHSGRQTSASVDTTLPQDPPTISAPPPTQVPQADASTVTTNVDTVEERDGEPAAPTSTLNTAEYARRFATEYFARATANGDEALAWMSSHYGSATRFFGKETPRDEILSQKAAYVRRWPERAFVIEPDSVNVDCEPAGVSCNVSGIVDWTTASADRDARASGKSSFTLGVGFEDNGPMILSEDSKVIQRGR